MRRGLVIVSRYRGVVATALIEAALLSACWQLYRYGRYLVRDQRLEAFANAADVIALERRLSLFVEPHVQRVALTSDVVVEVLNRYYVYMHVATILLCLCWLYCWHRPHYCACRRVLLVVMTVGLVIHAAFPLAPPRFVAGSRMVDTLAVFGPGVYSRDRFASITNQFAAMPSFHVGWAVLVAYYVIAHSRTRWRWAALAHPVIMTLAVMATANHYILDAAVGAGLVLAGIHVDGRIRRRSDQPSRAVPAPLNPLLHTEHAWYRALLSRST